MYFYQDEWAETGNAIEVGIKKGIVKPRIHKRYALAEVSIWVNKSSLKNWIKVFMSSELVCQYEHRVFFSGRQGS